MTPYALRRLVLGFAILLAGPCSAEVVNLTGVWKLNVERSKWGQVPKPVSIIVTIDHKEPAISYTGTMVYVDGEETREFDFDGAIDGKEYPLTRNFGEGKIVVQRVNDATITSEFKTDDGKWQESVRTTVTRDGKVMRRMIERKGPSDNLAWMELYEKQ